MPEKFPANKDPDVLLPDIDIDPENLTEDQLRGVEGQIIEGLERKYLKPWLRARQPIVDQCVLNHAFVNGHQYIELRSGAGLVPLKKKYRGQVRLVNNLMAPATRQLWAALTQNTPDKQAQATTAEFVPEAISQLAVKLLGHADRATKNNTKNLELFYWLFCGGNGAKRAAYNMDKGPWEEVPVVTADGLEVLLDEEDGVERTQDEVDEIIRRLRASDPSFDPAERFTPLVHSVRLGELDGIVLSPMQYVGNPATTYLEDHEILFIQNARSLEWIRRQFPDRGPDVKPDNNSMILWDAGSANVLPGMGMPSVQGFTSSHKDSMPETAIVTECFIRPTEKSPLTGDAAPFGVHFVWAGKVALTAPTNPFPYSEPPQEDAKPDLDFDLVHYRWRLNAGFWGGPLFTDLIPLQQSYNRRRSQINEAINSTVHSRLQIAVGSRIRRKKLSDVPGEVLVYSGAPASYLEPPTVRPYVFNSMETDVQQFNDVVMLHEASRQGRPPPQVRTAAGLRFLQEADSKALSQTLIMFEECEGEYGQKQLDRMNQFYEDERVIKYVGSRNRVEVALFRRHVFQYDWTVYVRPGSSFPDSRAAKIAEANEMLATAPQMFVRSDRQFDKELYARLVGMADIDSFLADQDVARQLAETEELDMDRGEFAPVLALDDHAMHLSVHTPRIRSNEFRKLMKENPEIARMKLEHVQQHEAQLGQQQQMEQAQAAMLGSTAQAAQAAQNAVMAQNAGAAAASEARSAVKNQEADEEGSSGNQLGGGVVQLLRSLMSQIQPPGNGGQL